MSAEDQIERLQAVARERGWTVPNVFSDRPATAKKDRRPSRTGTDRRDPVRRCAEGVLISGIDRVGRTLADLVTFM
jgi:hypothetical protein